MSKTELLVFTKSGHDYSRFVERKGMSWSRNDLDSENTTRTKDGRMRRDKITTKRKLEISVVHMTREELAQLDSDLSEPTFYVRYLDLHGRAQEREFYCSSFSAVLSDILSEDNDVWEQASFSLVEV